MDTIVAPITPLMRTSVIVIRVSGPRAFDVSKYLYVSGKKINDFKHKYVYHGEFIADDIRDDVIFYAFHSPNSYTGENVVEISFHGNPIIVQKALKNIYKLGIRLAEPGEFTKQAFLNGKIDLIQAEAVYELIDSKSVTGIYSSYEKLRSGMRGEIDFIKENFLDILSVVEAYIDFPEEDLSDFELKYVYERLDNIIFKLEKLISTFETFKYVNEGVKIAIIGKPNVGKSSLMNYLLRENRVIVSDIPGTTRDVVEEEINIKGYNVKLIDTAGIRNSNDKIEVIGIEFSKNKLNEADIVLFLFDLEKGVDEDDLQIMNLVKDKNIIKVANKLDKKMVDIDCDVEISVKTGEGVDDLLNILEKQIKSIVVVNEDNKQLLSERQRDVFLEILNHIKDIKKNFNVLTLDLLAVDLHFCLNKISELTGEIYTEDLLKNIFDKFCIGK